MDGTSPKYDPNHNINGSVRGLFTMVLNPRHSDTSPLGPQGGKSTYQPEKLTICHENNTNSPGSDITPNISSG